MAEGKSAWLRSCAASLAKPSGGDEGEVAQPQVSSKNQQPLLATLGTGHLPMERTSLFDFNHPNGISE
jgi:hypothetical protein